MHSTRKVTEDLIYVGGSDRRLSRFENLFPIPREMCIRDRHTPASRSSSPRA